MGLVIISSWIGILMWIGILGISSSGYKFYVGGRDGWVLTPSEDYSHWSHRNRFQVNDTLYFRYQKGSDSVLQVKQDDYNACNTKNPINSFNDGDTLVVLLRSGPFFFVTGNSTNCFRGQKLAVVVMSVHHRRRHSPSPSPSPSASSPPPSPAAVSPSPENHPSDSEALAPAPTPTPMSARNSGSVRSVVGSLGMVFAVMMSWVI